MIGEILVALLLLALLGASAAVVASRNLVHAVFWLALALITTAAVLVVLAAPFLAAIQVLLYAGGVITLMLFGVMLTHRDPDTEVPNPLWRQGPAGLTSATLLAVFLSAIWTTPELGGLKPDRTIATIDIGRAFLGEQLLAFEVLSVLLLAAMIGAIVLARKGDP